MSVVPPSDRQRGQEFIDRPVQVLCSALGRAPKTFLGDVLLKVFAHGALVLPSSFPQAQGSFEKYVGLQRCSLAQLKDLCRDIGLKIGGTKKELVARLMAAPQLSEKMIGAV